MTENQIKGCQLLAEVEGLKLQEIAHDVKGYMVKCKHSVYGYRQPDYVDNWNDLHRVAQCITNMIDENNISVEYYKKLVEIGRNIGSGMLNNDKLATFNALVEAAKWIKQNQK